MPRSLETDQANARPGILFLVRPGSFARMMVEYLGMKGFSVWATSKDIVAFDLFVRHSVEIDWLVLESEFLEGIGENFLQRFHRHFPGVKVCLLTDDPFDAQARELHERGGVIVPKPVSLRKFVHTLQKQDGIPAPRVAGAFLERHSWSEN